MDEKGSFKGQRTDHKDSFVRRIMLEKELSTSDMIKRSHIDRKTINAFLLKPYMTTGNLKAWFYGWAKALEETPQFVEKEMELLFAHRYYDCVTCKKRTFRYQNHQRFCSNKCRVQWRKETPTKYLKPNLHTIKFTSSYANSAVEITETPVRPSDVKSHFQKEIDQYLKQGGTIKKLNTAPCENQISIPREDIDEHRIAERKDQLGHEYWT